MKNAPYLVNADGSLPTESIPAIVNPILKGQILVGSYGYEASISHFYVVVEVSKTGKTAVIQEVQPVCKFENGGMDWTSTVDPENLNRVGEPVKKHIRNRDGHLSIRIHSCLSVSQWNGEVRHDYNYH